jgi:outer membrane protein TolC
MYRKTIISILGLCLCFPASAQLSIEECYGKARANYPQIKQYELIERAKDFNLSNAGKGYLPQVQLSAKISYQSEVTEIPVDFSKLGLSGVSIPRLSNDQYGAVVDISQTIWDGGAVEAKRELIRAKSELDVKELDVSMYAICERINQLFFGILLCDALIAQNSLFQDELRRNYDRIVVYIQNGVASQTDSDAVSVELLKARQALIQIVYTRRTYMEMISAFMGEKVDEDVKLQKPESTLPPSLEIRRHELTMFDVRNKMQEAARQEIRASLMPKVGLFLTGGYGNPGLNMLRNEFSAYYIGGVRITWNFGSFYSKKNSLNLIEVNRNTLATQRETFMFNTSLNKTRVEYEIDKYRELLKSDDEIIALRNSVKRSAESRLAGGTLNATDLMREITAEQMAIHDKIAHEIELSHAVYNLKFITNN